MNSPLCVPWKVFLVMTRSPSAYCSWMSACRSGNASKNIPKSAITPLAIGRERSERAVIHEVVGEQLLGDRTS